MLPVSFTSRDTVSEHNTFKPAHWASTSTNGSPSNKLGITKQSMTCIKWFTSVRSSSNITLPIIFSSAKTSSTICCFSSPLPINSRRASGTTGSNSLNTFNRKVWFFTSVYLPTCPTTKQFSNPICFLYFSRTTGLYSKSEIEMPFFTTAHIFSARVFL